MTRAQRTNARQDKIFETAKRLQAARWQDRAIAATHNGQSQFGCILLSALHRDTDDTSPRFGRHANVTSDGYVMCDFIDKGGRAHSGAFVGSYADLIANCVGLAKHLKLNSDEETALHTAVCSTWIATDYRARAV
jgi:hypothetical protein